jgi:hypothetical protein
VDATTKLQAQLDEQERRLERITGAMANAGWSDALGKQLREEEARLAEVRRDLDKATAATKAMAPVTEAWLKARFAELLGLTEKAVQKGKAALQGWFGPVTVFPVGEGPKRHYEAEGWIHVGPANLSESGAVLPSLVKSHCGGSIWFSSKTWGYSVRIPRRRRAA